MAGVPVPADTTVIEYSANLEMLRQGAKKKTKIGIGPAFCGRRSSGNEPGLADINCFLFMRYCKVAATLNCDQ